MHFSTTTKKGVLFGYG